MKTRLQAEEIAELWQADQHGEKIVVSDGESEAYFVAHGVRKESIAPMNGSIWLGIRNWQECNGYWPNIWSVNDHGNVTLWSNRGRSLGDCV